MNVLAQAPIDSTGWHRDPTQARKSGLDVLAEKSPAHYLHWCREEDRDTPALSFGSAFHCFVLEPKKFSERYAVAPAFGDLRFKDNKAKKAEFMETIGGRELVDADDYDAIRYMADAIHAHPTARNLIVAGQAEKEIRWTDAETGLSCGARLDFHIPEIRIAIDLKTCENASPGAFARSVASYRYHVQDVHYRNGLKAIGEAAEHFLFVAVEKSAPYGVSVSYVDDAGLDRGAEVLRHDMARLAECVRTNHWPCYSDDLVPVSLPAWAFYDN